MGFWAQRNAHEPELVVDAGAGLAGAAVSLPFEDGVLDDSPVAAGALSLFSLAVLLGLAALALA
jgi:hypothetical protein